MTANRAARDTLIADLDARLAAGRFDIEELGLALDESDTAARLTQVLALGKRAQAQLYEAAKGARKLRLEQLVPAERPDLTEVVHHGKNTLGVFTHFAKVFCRPKREAKELWGYNRAGGLIETGVGPGYYVAYEGPGDEVLIDYTRVPEGKPEHWPEIQSNKSRLSRFVYADMIDALRAVSNHVTVGRAIKNGKVMDNWFVLCRA
jgi:hypothetical protein